MIACPYCRTILPVHVTNTGRLHRCPDCTTWLRADVYNAFHRPVDHAHVGESVEAKGQAECFYHPGKKAVTPCSCCGRLLCALCEIEMDGRTLCTNCLKSGRNSEDIQSLGKDKFLYDSLALHLAFWPWLLFPFFMLTIFSAPVAIFLVLRYWNTSDSVIPRNKFRFVLAFLLAGGQLGAWTAIFFDFVSG